MEYYNPHFLVSTFFGVGKISKKFAGTVGSLAAIPFYYFLQKAIMFFVNYFQISNIVFVFFVPIIITLILFVCSAYSVHKYTKAMNVSDPKEVVIDEVLGQLLCFNMTITLTLGWVYVSSLNKDKIFYYDLVLVLSVMANFILFRAFDIFKPWPICYIDKKMKGAVGVMFDDFLAAIFAIVTYFASLFWILKYYY